jgi:hypothetical protein
MPRTQKHQRTVTKYAGIQRQLPPKRLQATLVCKDLSRIIRVAPKGMTAIHRLAPITRTIQALQDPSRGAAVSRLWRTSIEYLPSNVDALIVVVDDSFALSLQTHYGAEDSSPNVALCIASRWWKRRSDSQSLQRH